jgi:hypothetical protein
MFSKMDGAIEKFCPAEANPWTVVARESDLKRDVYDFVPLSGDKFLCLSTSPKNEIFVYDAKTKNADLRLALGAGFQYVDLVDGGGRYFVADRDEKAPGVAIVDVEKRSVKPFLRTALEPLSLLWMR